MVDEGNSFVKIAAYQGGKWLLFDTGEELSVAFLEDFLTKVDAASEKTERPKLIFSSVRRDISAQTALLSRYFDVLLFDHQTAIPIVNLYETPETLGKDRLAAAVGAAALFPETDILIVDAGTCITYDLIDRHRNYRGGGIMPGFSMNLRALHTFTGNLPFLTLKLAPDLCGRNTSEAILAGSVNAVLLGLDAIIDRFRQAYPDLKTITCGGDSILLHDNLKNDTFAEPKLALYGLKKILDFNEDT